MNTLQEIVKIAQEAQVKTRNDYRFKYSLIIETCIKSLDRLQACRLLVDLLGFNLTQCSRIIADVKDNNISFTDSCNNHLN